MTNAANAQLFFSGQLRKYLLVVAYDDSFFAHADTTGVADNDILYWDATTGTFKVAPADSGNVKNNSLSTSDINNGANGFVTKPSLEDSIAAALARRQFVLSTLGIESIADSSWSGIPDSLTAGENLTFGQLAYQDSTNGKYYKAQSNSLASTGACAVAVESITANAKGLFMIWGVIKCSAWTTMTPRPFVFVSATAAGVPTVTEPASGYAFGIGSCPATDVLRFYPPPPSFYVKVP